MNKQSIIQLPSRSVALGKCPGSSYPALHGKARHQSGAVLIISLIMLLLLTLIGTTGMQTSSLEEKMAGNMRDRNLAFQAAESALNAGEAAAKASAATVSCPTVPRVGYYSPFDANCDGIKESAPVWDNAAIWQSDITSVPYDSDGNTATFDFMSLNDNPRYIIEDLGKTCNTNTLPCPLANQKQTYRVTSRAVGGSPDSVVMLQSIFVP